MKTTTPQFNGQILQFSHEVYIEIGYNDEDDAEFHLHTRKGWEFNFTRLDEVYARALKALAQEEAE